MTFQENLNRICKEQGTTLTALVKRMGLSTSKVSRWNEGALPKQEMLLRLAKELRGTSPSKGSNPNSLFFVKHTFGFVTIVEEVG